MAVAAKNSGKGYYPTGTRVYVHSRGNVAYKPYEEELERVRVPQRGEALHAGTQTRITRGTARPKPLKNTLMKLLSLVMVAATVAAVLMVLIRYYGITSQYAAVNELRASIEESERTIEQLNVELNTAVDITAAREAALNAGMNYPSSEQIVKVYPPNNAASSGGE